MKKLIIFSVLFFVFGCAHFDQSYFAEPRSILKQKETAQTQPKLSLKTLINYIDRKKDPGTAVALQLNLPAGGYFYSKSKLAPIVFIFESFLLYKIFTAHDENYLYSILATKLFTCSHVALTTNQYNNRLKKELNLDLYIQK